MVRDLVSGSEITVVYQETGGTRACAVDVNTGQARQVARPGPPPAPAPARNRGQRMKAPWQVSTLRLAEELDAGVAPNG